MAIHLLAVLTFASLASTLTSPCTNPIVRKEWRTLQPAEKKSYLDAVNCILTQPSLTPAFNNSGVKSRYDDLLYTHIQQTFSIHYVGHFLPWHRYFVATYEHMLRADCGYDGAQPYWDWTLDAASDEAFVSSPVFDAELGFGGNGPFVQGNSSDPFAVPGRTGGGCVEDGPFSGRDDLVHLGPASSVAYNPQCLKRDLSPSFARRYLGMNQMQLTLHQGGFGWFDRVVEGGPSFDASGIHGGGHYGVGGTYGEVPWSWCSLLSATDVCPGQMGDLYASPADPIFYCEFPYSLSRHFTIETDHKSTSCQSRPSVVVLAEL